MRWLRLATFVAAAVVMPAFARAAGAQETIGIARELYAAAAYDEALLVLDRLRGVTPREEDRRAIEQYRAFCLLALGRSRDAEQAIEAIITTTPGYQPSDADASPRVRAAFADVRKRLVPELVQQRYASAKAAFDRKEYKNAAGAFANVLAVLDDPAVATLAAQSPLADVRTLAAGFRDLSLKAATPPPLPTPPPDMALSTPSLRSLVPVAVPGRIYGPDDRDVVAPAVIRQSLPRIAAAKGGVEERRTQGSIEVLIDERGAVEMAAMKTGIDSQYDQVAVNAARGWKYQPATVGGVPVKYRKIVLIDVKP